MGQQNDRIADSRSADWQGSGPSSQDELELARLNAARAKASEETAIAIARELNGPLTALLLYMGEIKHHGDQLSLASADRAYLQRVIENALLQTERVCAVIKKLGDSQSQALPTTDNPEASRAASRPAAADTGGTQAQKRLTRREREVLRLI